MKNGLYRIEARMEIEELRNGGHCMIIGDRGMVFAEIHPVKIKGTPKKEKPIIGLDGTVYTQDEDKQGWTGHTRRACSAGTEEQRQRPGRGHRGPAPGDRRRII